MTIRLIRTGLVTFALLASGAAFAQGKPYVFEAEEVIGDIQAPEVQIMVSRQNLNMDYKLELKESFIPRIIQSVETKPF